MLLDARPDGYVAWHGEGIVEQQPSGLPEGTYGEGQPVLAPDGSLRAVHGESGTGSCDFTMLTADPGRTDFTDAARYRAARDSRDLCSTTLETFSADYLVVSRSKYDAWFLVRKSGTWRRVTEDPSGQVRYPRPPTGSCPAATSAVGSGTGGKSSPPRPTAAAWSCRCTSRVRRPGPSRGWLPGPRRASSATRSSRCRRTPGARRIRSTSTSGAGRGSERATRGGTPTRPQSPTTEGPGTASWHLTREFGSTATWCSRGNPTPSVVARYRAAARGPADAAGHCAHTLADGHPHRAAWSTLRGAAPSRCGSPDRMTRTGRHRCRAPRTRSPRRCAPSRSPTSRARTRTSTTTSDAPRRSPDGASRVARRSSGARERPLLAPARAREQLLRQRVRQPVGVLLLAPSVAPQGEVRRGRGEHHQQVGPGRLVESLA